MKPVEHRVWYRRLLVRIRKFGWRLRVTPDGAWVLSRSGGLVVSHYPPTTRKACYALALEMRTQERAIKRKDKHGPSPRRRADRTTGPVWLFPDDDIFAEHDAGPAAGSDDGTDDNCVVTTDH